MAQEYQCLHIHQVDSWFFRNGRPMHMGESALASVQSLFPPPATTVVGCVRAALARANGWSGKGYWKDQACKDKIVPVLGEGFKLGSACFMGPFLARDGELLHPMPLHLLGLEEQGRWTPCTRLVPGQPVACDMDRQPRLPKVARDEREPGLKNGEGSYLTASGLDKVLQGELPDRDEVVEASDIRVMDPRTSNTIDPDTRTTGENALRGTVHVCLRPGVNLVLAISGLPTGDGDTEAWTLPRGLAPLGGEARLAELDPVDAQSPVGLPGHALPVDARRAMGVLLTPALFDNSSPGQDDELPGLPGWTVASACLAPVLRRGGWSACDKGPMKVNALIPAGSVFFLERGQDGKYDPAKVLKIGDNTQYGFGHMVLGQWNQQGDEHEHEDHRTAF